MRFIKNWFVDVKIMFMCYGLIRKTRKTGVKSPLQRIIKMGKMIDDIENNKEA